jgi:dihydroorotase
LEHDLVLEGRVVTPSGLQVTEVGIADGAISAVGHGLKSSRRIRTERCLIFPGFIDIHVHLREPGWEYKEDFRTGTRAAVHGGVTTVVDMPNNPTPTTTRSAIRQKRMLAEEKSVVDVRFNGGVSPLDLRSVKEISDDVVGYKIYLSETTGTEPFPISELGRAFAEIAKTSKPVSLHCESQTVIDQVRKTLRGEDAEYSELRPPEAESKAVDAAFSALKEFPRINSNICHASVTETLEAIGLVRKEKSRVFCEATLHHLYFNQRALSDNRMLKTNPPLRSERDRQSLISGLKNGTVSFLVTDHAPHTERDKIDSGSAGVPGLDDYSHVVSWLIRDQGVDPLTIAKVACSNPSKFLGLEDRGEISPGKKANITILDLHSPEEVRGDTIQSKCGWSPYEGRTFPGRVRWTMLSGEPLIDDFEVQV